MKTVVVMIMSVFLSNILLAQVDVKRHFASFNMGPSFPLGSFAQTSGDDAGFAKTGFNFNLEGSYYFTPNIGLGAMWGAFVNQVDNVAFTKEFNRQISSIAGVGNTSGGTVGSWSNGYFVLGPYFAIPLEKVSFDGKVLIGVLNVSTPTLNANVNTVNGTMNVKQESASGSAFGLNIGAGARFNLSNRWALRLNLDFISGKPSFNITTTASLAGVSSTKSSESSQSVVVLNLGFGVVYQFVKK